MDLDYENWRNAEIKRVGLRTQRDAEADIDRHEQERKVKVLDEHGESVQLVSADNAAIAVANGKASYSKKYFISPGLPGAETRYNIAPEESFDECC